MPPSALVYAPARPDRARPSRYFASTTMRVPVEYSSSMSGWGRLPVILYTSREASFGGRL